MPAIPTAASLTSYPTPKLLPALFSCMLAPFACGEPDGDDDGDDTTGAPTTDPTMSTSASTTARRSSDNCGIHVAELKR